MLENTTCLQPGGAGITGNYQMSNDFEVQQSICRFVASGSPRPDPILLFLQIFLPKSACVRAWCSLPPNEGWYQGTTPPPTNRKILNQPLLTSQANDPGSMPSPSQWQIQDFPLLGGGGTPTH